MSSSITRGLVGTFARALALTLSLSAASVVHAQSTTTAPRPAKTVTPRTATPPATGMTPAKAPAMAGMEPVDINHATAEQLKAVPGIGDAYAAKIIAGRPYANKAQLQSKKVLPAAVYKKVSSKLVAKQ